MEDQRVKMFKQPLLDEELTGNGICVPKAENSIRVSQCFKEVD